MKIQFYGAAGCVTGSCHLIKHNGKNILLDCGMFQGKDTENDNEVFPFLPSEIDMVIISHAHIDHTGRLPLLFKKGFRGKVYASNATVDLMKIMLEDSGHIQEMECEWKNRKRIRAGLSILDPLYTSEEAKEAEALYEGIEYDTWITPFHDFSFRFRDAGHLLGSSFIEISIKENGENKKIVYSGDVGNKDIPLIKDPTLMEDADYLIMEATYGDKLHDRGNSEIESLLKIINDTIKKGGNVIIPSFAIGRTQELLYLLNNYTEKGNLKDIEVYVDSPLAYECTKVFQKHNDYYDEDAKKLINNGDDPLKFKNLFFTRNQEDSAKLNRRSGIVIISSSGMCEAGRILHHLKHNIWRKECSIIFVGYQAEGTMGRSILEGAKKIKLFGEEVAVNAKVYNFPGLSGHADAKGLLQWVEGFKKRPKNIILVHGSKNSLEAFRKTLSEKGYKVSIANPKDKIFDGANLLHIGRREEIVDLLDSLEDIENLTKDDILAFIKKNIK